MFWKEEMEKRVVSNMESLISPEGGYFPILKEEI
jgi:hypothetical protein